MPTFLIQEPKSDDGRKGRLMSIQASSPKMAIKILANNIGCPESALKIATIAAKVLSLVKYRSAFNVSYLANVVKKVKNQFGTSYSFDDESRLYLPNDFNNSWKAFNSAGLVVAEYCREMNRDVLEIRLGEDYVNVRLKDKNAPAAKIKEALAFSQVASLRGKGYITTFMYQGEQYIKHTDTKNEILETLLYNGGNVTFI